MRGKDHASQRPTPSGRSANRNPLKALTAVAETVVRLSCTQTRRASKLGFGYRLVIALSRMLRHHAGHRMAILRPAVFLCKSDPIRAKEMLR